MKKVLDLQGRTLANPLHLLVVNEMYDLVDNEAILKHIIEMKEVKQQDFDVLRSNSESIQSMLACFSSRK